MHPRRLIVAVLVVLGRGRSAAIPTRNASSTRATPTARAVLCRRWRDWRPWRAGAVLPLMRRLQVAELSPLAR
jgi:hypothetical protein